MTPLRFKWHLYWHRYWHRPQGLSSCLSCRNCLMMCLVDFIMHTARNILICPLRIREVSTQDMCSNFSTCFSSAYCAHHQQRNHWSWVTSRSSTSDTIDRLSEDPRKPIKPMQEHRFPSLLSRFIEKLPSSSCLQSQRKARATALKLLTSR